MSLVISLPRDKAYRCARSITTVLRGKAVSRANLEALIGRLSFAQTAVYGKFDRAMLKPLYNKLYSKRYFPMLSPASERNLRWRVATIISLTPRLATQTRTRPDWVIYTDAPYAPLTSEGRIDALFFQIRGGPWGKQVDILLTDTDSTSHLAYFEATSVIFGLELPASALAVFHTRERLHGKAVAIYIDNNAALAALINGDSSSIAAYHLIDLLRYLAAAFNIAVWFQRVETAHNIADVPTMGGISLLSNTGRSALSPP